MRRGFAGQAHSVADAQAAAELLPTLLNAGDTVLVKGSRAVGLELVAATLRAGGERVREAVSDARAVAPGVGTGQR